MKYFLLIILFLISCEKKADVQKEDVSEEIKIEKTAVCVWDQGAVRADGNKNGKWTSSMTLGEVVTYLGETNVDSTDKNTSYHKIRLSDGKEGWVSDYVLEIDAKPSVVINDISIYKRPDLLTVSDQKLSRMEFIAIKSTDNEWSEVVGAEKRKKGWIQNAQVSLKAEDIAVAVLYNKAIQEKDPIKQRQKLVELSGNAGLQSSFFMQQIKSMVEPDSEAMNESETDSL